MKMIINVAPPRYLEHVDKTVIELSTTDNDTARVEIDFEYLKSFVSKASHRAIDFFLLSAAVYGIDRFVERRKNSVDGWSRQLAVRFPVRDTQSWQHVSEQLSAVLSFLTGDYWEISFYESASIFPEVDMPEEFLREFRQVNLFSGGLDSLIGAIDSIREFPNENILFVSHYDSQMKGPKGDQTSLLDSLPDGFGGNASFIPSIKVALTDSTLIRETTFRSRSLLFIGLALVFADGLEIPRIIVPENGSVSLNYPLSSSRRSACSTRTTHPTVVAQLRAIWQIIELNVELSNPYDNCTKGEMVAECADRELLSALLKNSNSCGKRGHRAHWEHPGATHCGVCMPCVYRRAAVLNLADVTTYGNNINNLRLWTKKGQDIAALLEYLKRPLSEREIKTGLVVNGVKDLSSVDRFANLVQRTRNELRAWVATVGNQDVRQGAGIQ